MKLSAFALIYIPLHIVKGQALVNFLVEHPYVEIEDVVVEMHNYIG